MRKVRGWLIFGIILLCLWLIGMIRAQVVLIYNGELALRVKVLGKTIGLMPKKPRKPLDPDDFSPKKYRKLLEKEAKAQAKKDAKKAKKKAKAEEKKKSKQSPASADAPKKQKKKKSLADILDLVYMGLDALKPFGRSFGKHFEIEAVKLRITVGSEDAAKTAMLYGILVQAVAYLLELLSVLTNLRIKKQNRGNILVDADFTSETIAADLHLIFKLRFWHLFAMGFSALGGIIKNRLTGLKGSTQTSAQSADRSVGQTEPMNS